VADAPSNADTGDAGDGASQNTIDLVVLLSIDGLRPDAIGSGTPNLSHLKREGSYADSAVTVTNSSTLPSHASMLSGVQPELHGLNFNAYRPERGFIRVPSIFLMAERAGLPTAMFVAKQKLHHILREDSPTHFKVAGRCASVVSEFTSYLKQKPSGLAFLHFGEPDHAGHRHGWMTPQYKQAVHGADSCVGALVETLRNANNADRIMLIVTSDHGGHGRGHGSALAEDRHIPWIAWGHMVNHGLVIHRPLQTLDTAQTALYALGVAPGPAMAGAVVVEGFRSGAPAPVVAANVPNPRLASLQCSSIHLSQR